MPKDGVLYVPLSAVGVNKTFDSRLVFAVLPESKATNGTLDDLYVWL
jgi:hypothetical protein